MEGPRNSLMSNPTTCKIQRIPPCMNYETANSVCKNMALARLDASQARHDIYRLTYLHVKHPVRT